MVSDVSDYTYTIRLTIGIYAIFVVETGFVLLVPSGQGTN